MKDAGMTRGGCYRQFTASDDVSARARVRTFAAPDGWHRLGDVGGTANGPLSDTRARRGTDNPGRLAL